MVLLRHSLEVIVWEINSRLYKQTDLEITVSILLLYMFNRMHSSQTQMFHKDNQISLKHSFLIKSINSMNPINKWSKNSSQEFLTFKPLLLPFKLKTQIFKMKWKRKSSNTKKKKKQCLTNTNRWRIKLFIWKKSQRN